MRADGRPLDPGGARREGAGDDREGDDHRRRPRRRGAEGRDAHQGGAGARDLHPALLLARAHEAGRHVPHVPRRDRGRARSPARVHHAGGRRHGRQHAVARGEGRAGRRARAAARQPPARLPGVRPRRRVPAAGHDPRVRSRRVALHRGEAALGEADPAVRSRAPRPRALHPVRALHTLRRRDRGRSAHHVRRARRPHRDRDLPRRAVRLLLLRQHRADLPGGRADLEALPLQGAAVGPLGGRDELHRSARSTAAARSSRAPTAWCACSASTASRSTTAGCATRVATATRPCTTSRACVHPMVRRGGELVECSWPEALDAAAEALRNVLAGDGADAIGVLGGARGTNEDAYVWARFAKGVLRTDNVDAQLGDGLPAEVALGLPHATIADLDRARGDRRARRRPQGRAAGPLPPRPARGGRARRAADRGHPDRHRAHAVRRRASIRYAPGEQGAVVAELAAALGGGSGATGDIAAAADAASPGATATSSSSPGGATSPSRPTPPWPRSRALAGLDDARASSSRCTAATSAARSTSASRPGSCPAGSTLEDGRDWFEDAWGAVPSERGPRRPRHPAGRGRRPDRRARAARCRSARRLPRPRARGRGRHRRPVRDRGRHVPHRQHARAPMCSCPSPTWGEQDGTVTNLEGRVQRVARKVSPDGTAMPDWRIAAELALRLREDFDLATAEEVQDEIARRRAGVRRRHEHPAASRPRRRRAADRRAPRRDRPPSPLDPADRRVVGADRARPGRRRRPAAAAEAVDRGRGRAGDRTRRTPTRTTLPTPTARAAGGRRARRRRTAAAPLVRRR